MNKILKSTKKILEKYDYLHYNAITQLIKNEGVFGEDVKNIDDILNNLILEDIKNNGLNSTFIQVGLGYYALRKLTEEENLFSYLVCRLRNFAFWQIDKYDIEYSFAIFGKDLFNTESLFLFLENLKNKGKINSYNNIMQGQIVVGLKI